MARHRYERKRNPRRIYLWVLVLILLAGSVWGVSAKYRMQREQDMLVQAKMFYFTSDLLQEDGFTYYLNPGTSEVTFHLYNYIDSLRTTDPSLSIQYDVYINNEQLGDTAALTAEHDSAEIKFSLENNVTLYEVRVEGNVGYQKNLYATFNLLQYPHDFCKHLDKSDKNYVLLTVWTKDIAGNVTVKFPDGLIPDTTAGTWANIANFSENGYTSSTTNIIKMEEYNSISYRFFKENPTTDYTVDQFTVQLTKADGSTVTAVTGEP